MKKIIIYLCLFSAIKADSQNLVLNPSFEDTIACPTTTAIPMQCEYWYTANIGSPDYFSEQPDIFCGTSYVPQSGVGYQYARTGIPPLAQVFRLVPYYHSSSTKSISPLLPQ